MSLNHRNSLHHLYYSSHADPSVSESLLRTNALKSKSSYQLNQFPISNKYGSRWTIAQSAAREQLEARQEKVHNTYYNNMMCYINYRQGNDTDSAVSKTRRIHKSVESLAARKVEGQITQKEKEEPVEDCAACRQCDTCCTGRGCCTCSSAARVCWCLIMAAVCMSVGFLAGIVVGAVIQREGYLSQVEWAGNGYRAYDGYMQNNRDEDGVGRCIVRMAPPNATTNCSICSSSRILNVTGAGYADCNGLYTLSNLTSIWDSKQVVYERIHGGWGKEKRFIYWNAHYYGEHFYGWSIGDEKSLFESGPFHSQGRGGASNLPWRGTWRGNVTINLSSCQVPIDKVRLARPGDPRDSRDRERDREWLERERERELNRLRNIERNTNIFTDYSG